MIKTAVMAHVYLASGLEYSRIWRSTDGATYNCDIVRREEAQKLRPGMEIQVRGTCGIIQRWRPSRNIGLWPRRAVTVASHHPVSGTVARGSGIHCRGLARE